MNGAGPLWTVGWLAAAILVPALAVTALTKALDRRRGRRMVERLLADLRPDTARPVEPLDPCVGLGPIRPLPEPARRRAIATLIATASRHLR